MVLMLASALGGCGRRGALLAPPDPKATAADSDAAAADGKANDVTKSGLHKRPKRTPTTVPTDPFILDPIL